VEEPCSPPPILEETELAFGLELPPPSMRSSSSSSSGSYDLKDAMADPSNDLERVVSATAGHMSETELDRDVSVRYRLGFLSRDCLNGSEIRRKERSRNQFIVFSSPLGGSSIVIGRLRRIAARSSHVERGGASPEEEDVQPRFSRKRKQRRATGVQRGAGLSGQRRSQPDAQPSSQIAKQANIGTESTPKQQKAGFDATVNAAAAAAAAAATAATAAAAATTATAAAAAAAAAPAPAPAAAASAQ